MEKLSKIGDVEFSVTTAEDVKHENEVTDRPVEDLGYISDHVKQKPIKFSVAGVVTGVDAFNKLKALRKYCEGKEVYKYFGRNLFSDVIIENLSTSHSGNIRNGFGFSMECKIVKRAVSVTVPVQAPDPVTPQKGSKAVKTQTKPVKSKGKVVADIKKTDNQKHDKYKAREKRCAAEYATLKNPSNA